MNLKKGNLIVIIILVFLLGAGAGFGIHSFVSPDGNSAPVSEGSGKYKEKLDELLGIIEKEYYKAPDKDKLAEGIYKGLFAGLEDPYSAYMTEEEYRTYEDSVTGEFEGIGITFHENKKGDYVILSTVKGSPAEKAGLKKDDIILKVDGKAYDDVDKVSSHIKGEEGTTVKILFRRGKKEFTKKITRAKIVMDTVESKMLKDKIGYIKISAFENNTAKDYNKAFEKLERENMKGFIIDLRDNGGGLVNQAVNIADTLLDKCTITYLQDRAGKKDYYRSDEDHTSIPYVILVNGNTASSSEILTAAIKDKGQGKIVGQKTYGKGVVQISDSLSDGSGYKLTVMQYFSPNGNTINKKGVKPDYKVKGSAAQLKKAEDLLK